MCDNWLDGLHHKSEEDSDREHSRSEVMWKSVAILLMKFKSRTQIFMRHLPYMYIF